MEKWKNERLDCFQGGQPVRVEGLHSVVPFNEYESIYINHLPFSIFWLEIYTNT